MSELLILQNPEVAARTSPQTRRVLEQRANPKSYTPYLSPEHMTMLRSLVDTILPQDQVGTHVDIAETIDRRLASGENAGWRYAVLPPDGKAYQKGLSLLHSMLEQTPMKSLDRMPPPAREGYLRCVANGDVDGPANFPLSFFLKLLRTDIVRTWVSHPDAMLAMQYYGFADGATGNEGWSALGPNSAAPFEYTPATELTPEAAAARIPGQGTAQSSDQGTAQTRGGAQ